MERVYPEFGALLRQARESAGLTQAQLAGRVSLTRTSITNIESGAQRVPLHLLYDLAGALRVDAASLLPSLPENDDVVPVNLLRGLKGEERRWVKSIVAESESVSTKANAT